MITERQRQLRRKSIGSSDAACVLGLDGYRTAYDLWLEKTGRTEGFQGNEATERGELLEPAILKYAAGKLGKVVKAKSSFTLKYEGVTFRAHVDGMREKFAKGSEIVEAKNMVLTDDFGPDGSGEVPINVYAQVQHQMMCAESPSAHVALLGKFGFSLHPVEADPEFQRAILEQGVAFWAFVEADEPPPLKAVSESTMRYLQHSYRQAQDETEMDDEHMRMYQHWSEVEAEAKERKRHHKAHLLRMLGDHRKGVGEEFQVYMKRGGGGMRLDAKAIREDHPDLCEAYMTEDQVYHYPVVTTRKKASK